MKQSYLEHSQPSYIKAISPQRKGAKTSFSYFDSKRYSYNVMIVDVAIQDGRATTDSADFDQYIATYESKVLVKNTILTLRESRQVLYYKNAFQDASCQTSAQWNPGGYLADSYVRVKQIEEERQRILNDKFPAAESERTYSPNNKGNKKYAYNPPSRSGNTSTQ